MKKVMHKSKKLTRWLAYCKCGQRWTGIYWGIFFLLLLAYFIFQDGTYSTSGIIVWFTAAIALSAYIIYTRPIKK